MSKRTVIVCHGNSNNESWVEREFKHANIATGGIYTGDCPDCNAKKSMVFDPDLGHYICTSDNCYKPTLIIINKTMAMGKSEQRINNMWGPWEQKVLLENKSYCGFEEPQ